MTYATCKDVPKVCSDCVPQDFQDFKRASNSFLRVLKCFKGCKQGFQRAFGWLLRLVAASRTANLVPGASGRSRRPAGDLETETALGLFEAPGFAPANGASRGGEEGIDDL